MSPVAPNPEASRRLLAGLVHRFATANDAEAFTFTRLALKAADLTGQLLPEDLERAIEACNRTRERLRDLLEAERCP